MENLLSLEMLEKAVNRGRAQKQIAWPADRLGVYGSHTLDGSHFPPDACDRAMDLYVAERFSVPEGVPVRVSACAGRNARLQPVIVVTAVLDASRIVAVSR